MKKLLSTILALSMLLTCVFNFTVSAEENSIISSITAENGTVTVEFNGEVKFTDNLADAVTVILNNSSVNFTAVNEDGKLVITITGEIQYNVDYSLTLHEDFTGDENVSETFRFVKAEFADFYAGVGSITVEYTADIPADGAGDISLTDESGAAVSFTSSTKGKVLTIVPEEKLVRDTEQYTLTVGDVTKSFVLTTVWEPKIDTENYTFDGFTYANQYQTGEGQYIGGVTKNGEILYKGRQWTAFPTLDTNNEAYKNASLSFDAKSVHNHMNVYMGFNSSAKNNDMSALFYRWPENATWTLKNYDLFGWYACTQKTEKVSRAYRVDTEGYTSTTEQIDDKTYNVTADGVRNDGGTIAPECPVTTNLCGVSGKGNELVNFDDDGSVIFADTAVDNVQYHSYSIDKMGSLGTLTLDGELVDRFETSELYQKNPNNAREYGYFFLVSNNAALFKNMAITVCEEIKTPTITKITDFYAGANSITVKYDQNISSFGDVGRVQLKDKNGADVKLSKSIKNNILTIVPYESLASDSEYTVTVGANTRSFKLKTIWELKTDYQTGTVTGLNWGDGDGIYKGVAEDGSLFMRTNYGALFPNVDKQDRASLTFDVVYTGRYSNIYYGFNASVQGGYLHYVNANNPGNTTAFMWSASNQSGMSAIPHQKLYRAGGSQYNVSNPTAALAPEVGITPESQKVYANIQENGQVSFQKSKTDTTVVDIGSLKKYSYSIDKMGDFATLTIDNTLVDRFNTQDYMAEGVDAPTDGYFFIEQQSANQTDTGIDVTGALYSNMKITVCELTDSIVNMTDFYAGTGSITAKFDESFTIGDLGAISLKDKNGADVAFTTSIKDKLLTIVPGKKLDRDAAYTLTIGKTEKRFMLKTVWEPKTDYEKGTVTGFVEKPSDADTHCVGVTKEGYIGAKSANGALYPDTDKYENASFSFDVVYTNYWTNNVIGFNAQTQVGTMGYENDKDMTKTAYMWNTANQTGVNSVIHSRMWRNNELYKMANDDRVAPENVIGLSSMNWVTTDCPTYTEKTEVNEDGTTKITGYTVDYGTHDLSKATKYSYSIDKLGALGTLVVDGQLVDRFDTKAVDANAPTSGYFMFYLNKEVVLSNMAITVCVDPDALEDDLVKVTQATCTAGANNTLSGTVTVANTYSVERPVTVVVAAYKGTTLLDLDLVTLTGVTDNKLATHSTASGTYSLEGTAGYDKVKVLVWDSLDSMSPWDCHVIN